MNVSNSACSAWSRARGSRTQREIADKLDISRVRYSHYENERVQPDAELLKKMADLFDVTVDYLLGRTEKPVFDIERESDKESLFFFDQENIAPKEAEELKKHLEFLRYKARQENKKK